MSNQLLCVLLAAACVPAALSLPERVFAIPLDGVRTDVASVSSTLSGQRPQPKIHRPDSSPPERIDLSGVVEVPLSLQGGLPIVEVRVNGQGPFRFGIETGSASVIVVPDLVARLGLKRTGGPDDFPEYRLDALEIGSATFHRFPVSSMRFAQTGIDGILGLSLYRDLLLTIDYPRSRAMLTRGDLPQADGSSVLALTRVGPFWGVPIAIGGKPMTAVLDTRSTGAFGLTPEAAAGLAFDGDLRVVGRARGAAIAETEVKAGRLASDITVGRYTFPTPMVTVRALPPGFPTEPLIGTRVLGHFTVTLDQRSARLRLERSGPATITLDAGLPPEPSLSAPSARDVRLEEFAGRYGVRVISVANGRLMLQRDGGPQLEMTAAGRDGFGLAAVPEARIEFTRDEQGKVTAMRVLNREGQWETAPRDR